MFGCAGYDAPSGGGGYGGDGDGGGRAGVSLVQSSGAALPPLVGPPHPSVPVLRLKGAPGLGGSPGNPSSWGQLASCFSALPGTRQWNVMVRYMHMWDTHMLQYCTTGQFHLYF